MICGGYFTCLRSLGWSEVEPVLKDEPPGPKAHGPNDRCTPLYAGEGAICTPIQFGTHICDINSNTAFSPLGIHFLSCNDTH